MPTDVYLHIGAPKSGSTHLQGLLHANQAALAEQGLLVPGAHADHFRLMMHATGRDGDLPRPKAARRTWDRLLAEVGQWPGSAVLSHEMLCTASPEQAAALREAVGRAEAHIVYTVRDLARTLPSEWQQAVRGGLTIGFDDYVRAVRDRGADAEPFFAMHDVWAVLARWGTGLDPRRVHVVTVPRPGADRDLLWRRFAQVLGVKPETASAGGQRANESLGAVEAELLRRVNVAVRGVMDADDPALVPWMRRNVALKVLAHRASQQRFAIRPSDYAWVVERSRQTAEALAASGYDIVGDLADLVPDAAPVEGPQPDDAGADEIAAAAVDTIAGLAAALRQAQRGEHGHGDESSETSESEADI
jgi:hypothetical protein